MPEFLLLALICLTFLSFSIVYFQKIISAPGIYLITIIVAVICTIIGSDADSKIIRNGFFYISIGIILFLVSFFVGQHFSDGVFFHRKNSHVQIEYNLNFVNKILNITCVCALLQLLISLYIVLPIAGSIQNIFLNSTWVRYQYLNRESNAIVSLIANLSNIITLVFVCLVPVATKYKIKYARVKLLLLVGIKTLTSLITMSKEAAILYLILIVSSYADDAISLKKEVKFLRKNLKWLLAVVGIIFIAVAVQRSYVGTKYNSMLEAIIGTAFSYFYLPVVSFGEMMTHGVSNYTNGVYSFRPIINILSVLGVTSRVDIKQETLFDNSSNVYTMFGTMYRDFGSMGIPLVSFIYGIICGLLYKRKHNGRLFYRVSNSMVTMVLAFGFYDFKFIQTIYILVIIAALIFDKLLSGKLYVLEFKEAKRYPLYSVRCKKLSWKIKRRI